MLTIKKKPSLISVILAPGLIYVACVCIVCSKKYNENSVQLSLTVLLDLLVTAPAAYFLIIRRTTASKILILRVFMIGIVLASVLLSKNDLKVLAVIKTWVSPLVETICVGFIVWKFYKANKNSKGKYQRNEDFLIYCRAVLLSVLGAEKIANAFASEIAVFYYIFCKRDKAIDNKQRFTCYKENGIVLVLYTILFLFLIETTGMHFIFLLWNKTAAWILTILSLYTCLQLFAHIKALQARPVIIDENQVFLRNGLMGGDVTVLINHIENAEINRKKPGKEAVVQLALLKGLENHNIVLYFTEPQVVQKAFGIKKTGKILLVHIDRPQTFLEALEIQKSSLLI